MIWKTKTVQLPGSIKREFSIISRAMNWKSTVCCLTCSEYHLLQSKVHQSGHSLNPCLVFTQNACLNCSGLCSQMKVPGNSESSSHFQLLTAFWDKKGSPKAVFRRHLHISNRDAFQSGLILVFREQKQVWRQGGRSGEEALLRCLPTGLRVAPLHHSTPSATRERDSQIQPGFKR